MFEQLVNLRLIRLKLVLKIKLIVIMKSTRIAFEISVKVNWRPRWGSYCLLQLTALLQVLKEVASDT